MLLGFRHADPRFPFWDSDAQPAGRWRAPDAGAMQWLADTPDGAWAEFLRHEGITDPADLAGIERRLWAVEIDPARERMARVVLPDDVATGDETTYPQCRAAAEALRTAGATCLVAASAALRRGGARGQVSGAGPAEAPAREGTVWVLLGPRPDLRAWAAVDAGAPAERVLRLVRHFGEVDGHRAADRRAALDRRQMIDLVRKEKGEPERRRFLDRRDDERRRPDA